MSVDPALKSPCIGVCSTGIGDSVCRGCKRYSHEIINWNAYGAVEKRAVLDRLGVLLAQVVQAKLSIVDEALLRKQLKRQKIYHNPEASPHSWVFELLKVGASQIDALEDYGCSVLRGYELMSLSELRDSIDADYYVLSSVHYQRYFEMSETLQ